MKTMVGLLFVLLAAWPGPLQARLGETPAACARRYGEVLEEVNTDGVKVQTFERAGFTIRVYFLETKEALFTYSKAAAVVYSRPSASGAQNLRLSATELRTFLDANAQGEEWHEADLIKEAAEARPGPDQSKRIRTAMRFALWRRRSGATAHYLTKTHELFIRATDAIPLPEQESPDYLEGF